MNNDQVEIVYVSAEDHQCCLFWVLDNPASVGEVIDASGILDRFPEIDLAVHKVGIFGKLCNVDRLVEAGDRIEIYRPLVSQVNSIRAAMKTKRRSRF